MDKRKKKFVKKLIALGVFFVIILMLLPTLTSLVENPPAMAYIRLPEKYIFEFERTIAISAIGTYTLNITIPQNNTFQKVYVSDLSAIPKTVNKDYNRTWWSYTSSGSTTVTLHYSGETYLKVWDISDSLDVDAIPQNLKTQYDHSEYILDSNGDKIWVIQPELFKNIALNITKGKENVVEKLRAIYDVIVNNFVYEKEKSGIPKTAVQTWNDKSGDCDELSFVFVSLARSIGIPAWVEYGLLYTSGAWGGHAWVGTVVPTKNGIVRVNIDLTTEVGDQDLGRGFLIRNPNRLTEWCDDGNSQHLSSYYKFIYGAYRNLNYNEEVKIIKMQGEDYKTIPLEDTQIPQWVMVLIIGIIIIAVVAAIVKW